MSRPRVSALTCRGQEQRVRNDGVCGTIQITPFLDVYVHHDGAYANCKPCTSSDKGMRIQKWLKLRDRHDGWRMNAKNKIVNK